MKYRLQDGNTIVATQEFIDQHYPGAERIIEPPTPAEINAPVIAQLDAIYASIRKDRTQAELSVGDPAALAWVQAQLALAAELRKQLVKE